MSARRSDLDRQFGEDFDLRKRLKKIEAELVDLRAAILGGGTPVPAPTGGTTTPAPMSATSKVYAQSMLSSTTWAIPGGTHGIGSSDLQVTCYNNATIRAEVKPTSITVNRYTFAVTIKWAFATAGRVVISGRTV